MAFGVDDLALSLLIFFSINYTLNIIFDGATEMIFGKKYEQDFVDHHRHFIQNRTPTDEAYLPLGFEYEHTANLLDLCGQYFSKWTTSNYYIDKVWIKYTYDPKIEVRRIGFRRLADEINPVRAAMIRCNKRWAIVKGVQDGFAFMLRKSKGVFYIYGRFLYKEDRTHPETQKLYEEEFLQQHQEFLQQHLNDPNAFIQLAFEQQPRPTEALLKLCNKFRRFWSIKSNSWFWKYQPEKKIEFIGFRRIELARRPGLVRAEIIRCNEKFAFIEAERNRSGYLLKKSEIDENTRSTIFHIYKKFRHDYRYYDFTRDVTREITTEASTDSDENDEPEPSRS